MGSLGAPELIVIFIIALLLFGPRKLPEIGRSIGQAMREFKKATNSLVDEIQRADEAPSHPTFDPRKEPEDARNS